jgi:hypothetical protein
MNTTLTHPQAERLYGAIDNAILVAYDGCHKIYLALDEEQAEWFRGNYDIIVEASSDMMLAAVERWWEDSCGLRFISGVRTNHADPNAGFTTIISQFEDDDE